MLDLEAALADDGLPDAVGEFGASGDPVDPAGLVHSFRPTESFVVPFW
ncbi:hypothetical protein ACFWBN_32490 [Streptomyces sp. NPDC059989]